MDTSYISHYIPGIKPKILFWDNSQLEISPSFDNNEPIGLESIILYRDGGQEASVTRKPFVLDSVYDRYWSEGEKITQQKFSEYLKAAIQLAQEFSTEYDEQKTISQKLWASDYRGFCTAMIQCFRIVELLKQGKIQKEKPIKKETLKI